VSAAPNLQLSEKQRLLREKLLRREGIASGGHERIPRRDGNGPAPLSFGQLRLWFLHQLDPAGAAYNIPEAVRLSGPLDRVALRRTLAEVVRRHEVLRTIFAVRDGEPEQRIEPPFAPDLPVADLAFLPAAVRIGEASRLVADVAQAPFDLARGPVLRAALLRLGAADHVLVLALHHIAADGWSIGILVRELTALYAAFSRNASAGAALPEPALQYADFAVWQRARLDGEALEARIRGWKERLRGAPTALEMPTDRPRPSTQSFRGARQGVMVGSAETTRLRVFAQAEGATPFMVLVSALGVLLKRWTGQDDLLIGYPSANRSRPEVEGMFGFLLNTLVVRLDLAGDPALPALLARAREAVLWAEANQDLPFERLVDALELPRDLSRSPLFQVQLAFQNLPAAGGGGVAQELTVSPFGFETETSQLDLSFLLLEGPNGLFGDLRYRTDLFDPPTAGRLARHLGMILAGIAVDPQRPISALPMLAEGERQQLLAEWNDTAAVYPEDADGPCLHSLIEAQARRTPEAPAATFEGATLTYAELDLRAGRLARRLRALGAGPETRVAVTMERSLELITALLAVLKAGAAYVPLDPDYPRERLAGMLADARPAVLLTQEHLAAELPPVEQGTGVLALVPGAPESGPDAPLGSPLGDTSLAYMIFTSGSTGRPKGAMVHHRAIRNRLLWMQDAYRLTPGDTVLQKTPFSFDVSVWEFFWPLLAGARLVLAKPGGHRDAAYLAGLITAERVTVLHFVPSLLQAFLEEPEVTACASLRLVVASGEALSPELVRRFGERLGHAALENLYGPTEAAVDVTAWSCRPEAGLRSVPIGRPIANTRIQLVDRALRPVPIGVAGELLIGGVNVGRGYLGRPELTAEKFIPDPFSALPGARLYRTGDLARTQPGGAVEFLGRIDHQVKLRGFRIELGEIETILTALPAVRDAAVALREERGSRRLVAYVVPRPGAAASADELRRALRERLPEFMVPAAFVTLDALPLSPNGKLDRRALPAPEPAAAETGSAEPPEGPIESALAEIWAKVLGLDSVGVRANFFSLGGDSILTLQVVTRARELGLAVTLQDIFQHQTVRDLARVAGGGAPLPALPSEPFALLGESDRALIPEGLEDAYPLARLQAGMLFHSELAPETAVYHDVFSTHLRTPFDGEAMRRAVARTVELHPVLRTSFALSRFSEPLQLVHAAVDTPLAVDDLRDLPEEERAAAVAAWLEAERLRPFAWGHPPLVRFHIHRRSNESFQFTLSFHHSVLDGWSAAALQTALFRFYLALIAGQEAPAEAPPAARFRDFVALERATLIAPEAQEFWRRNLAGAAPSRLPRWPVPPVEKPQARDLITVVPADVTVVLRRLARGTGLPLKSVLLAVHLKVVSFLTGQPDGLTGLTVNGRPEEGGGDQVLGLFLNMLPYRLHIGSESWRELAVAGFELERMMLPFRRYPIADLQTLYGGGQPLFDISFNFIHFHVYKQLGEAVAAREIEVIDGSGYEEVNFPLGANFSLDPAGGTLLQRLTFNDGEFAPGQAAAISAVYHRALRAMATDPSRPHGETVMLDEAEQEQILAWGDGGTLQLPALPVHLQIAAQAARTPEATALAFAGERWSYAELDRRAARVAGLLRARGVGPESRVALFLERSLDLPAVLLGIWRAGAAAVPLDPAHPAERLAFVLEDSAAAVVMTQEALRGALPDGIGAHILALDSFDEMGSEPGTVDAEPPPAGWHEQLAYVIYTSGSTGRPKGVLAGHGNLAATLAASKIEHGWTADDVMPCLAPFSFDISLFELLNPLLAGGTAELIALRPHLDLERLLEALGRATRLHAVPALMRRILERIAADPAPEGGRLPGLRTVFVGGEAVPADLLADLRRILPHAAVHVLYGPTEATIICSSHRVPEGGEPRPLLGRALPGAALRVCDMYGHPVPPATPGEIRIGGLGVTLGYLGRPELTAERFVTAEGVRFYRSGDLARWSVDGELEFLGRADDQIKIRGFRVELGEIEAALAAHPAVAEAVVAARRERAAPGRPADSGDLRLVGYVVPRPGAAPEASELRDFVRAALPDYMVPAAFVTLGELPLSPHGKVDRRALPEPERSAAGASLSTAPRNATEERLAELWCEVLGIPRVGIEDNFLALGGHSLLAMQLITRVRGAFSIDLPLRMLYETSSLEELAVAVAAAEASRADAAALAELLDELELMRPEEVQTALSTATEGTLKD
jgi:amino acid adenylation domain-containing protein